MTVRKLNHWYLVNWLCWSMALFSACGRDGGDASFADSLALELHIPADEEASLFWYGVEKRSLEIKRDKEEPLWLTWESNKKQEVDLREGDLLHFLGTDRHGRVLVEGEVLVRTEKRISIPLHRVL